MINTKDTKDTEKRIKIATDELGAAFGRNQKVVESAL